MRKKARSKYPVGTQCAYCTLTIEMLEEEHVFPDSWYAQGTPKPKMMIVPACRGCNGFYSRTDGDARIWVLTCEPDDPLTQDIQKSVQRSLDPRQARSDADRRSRSRRMKSLQDALCVVPDSELGRAFWSANQTRAQVTRQTSSGIYLTGKPAMRVPPLLHPIVLGKWIRGSYYYTNKGPLLPFAPWSWAAPTALGDPKRLMQMCAERMLPVFDRPEFRVWGVTTSSDPVSSFWMFALWDKMIFFGMTGRFAYTDAVQIIQRATQR